MNYAILAPSILSLCVLVGCSSDKSDDTGASSDTTEAAASTGETDSAEPTTGGAEPGTTAGDESTGEGTDTASESTASATTAPDPTTGSAESTGGSNNEGALAEFCQYYIDCGDPQVPSAEDCFFAYKSYFGDCPAMNAALDDLGACFLTLSCTELLDDDAFDDDAFCKSEKDAILALNKCA